MMDHSLVTDIATCVIAAWVVAVASQVVRQPLLLAYLVAGFAVGPHGFKWVTDAKSIQVISEIGLSLLLFMIGLEIDLKRMASAGKVITVTAAAQIIGCVGLGWLFFGLFSFATGWLEALYLGVAVALSSTVIIVKILYDKRELDTLVGRVTLGVLVLQDLFVILFLAIQPDLKNPALLGFGLAMLKVALLVGVGYVFSRFVLPPIFRFVARQPELVLVGALAWCFALAGFARYLGLSPEMGALIAGVMVSTFPYTLDVIAKVTSLRDFFVTLFFVGLGMTIPVPTWSIALWTLAVSAFVVLSRMVTVVPVLHSMRLGHRVSFLPALNLCQISELSLVLLALGKASGDVSDQTMGIVAFAFAFLAIGSTYAIGRSEAILPKASRVLTRLGLRDLKATKEDAEAPGRHGRIFLLGFSWTASSLLEEIRRRSPHLLDDLWVIDFNPVVIERLRERGVHVIYGDISQRDTLLHAGLAKAEIIICSLPDMLLKGASNRRLLQQLHELNPDAKIIVHAENLSDVETLYAAGASYISAPRLLEAAELLHAIEAADISLLHEKRAGQLKHLAGREEVIP
jgi:Kef-type K+ transport system membrane component KefB